MLIVFIIYLCIFFTIKQVYRQRIDKYIRIIPELFEFNSFERKRLGIYLDNLLIRNSNIPIRISDDDVQYLCTFDPLHDNYYKKIVSDAETIRDLSHYEYINNKFFKISLNPDSIDWFEVPTIVKSRYIHGNTINRPYAIIGRLRSQVHFGLIQTAIDLRNKIPFENKKPVVIWRGGPSGTGFKNEYESYLQKPSRENMLKIWYKTIDDIDVGLIPKWNYKDFEQYLESEMTLEDLIGYKYLLSIEGNDVATNLKWALASNSVVIMPRPYVESWFTESLLEPWVHYVPIRDDFSNLHDIKIWCDNNTDLCKEIIHNANIYTEQFINEDRERYLFKYVLEQYFKSVTFIR